jgi:hypothetical protein
VLAVSHYLIEHYVSADACDRAACGLQSSAASETHVLLTLYVREDETCFHLVDASSRELVERSSEKAGLAPGRIVAVEATLGDLGRLR